MIIILDNIFTLVVTFLAVAAVIYLSYLFSRYLSLGAAKFSNAKYLKVLDRVPVGQDKLIAIVKVNDRHFLLGVSSQNINLLTELEPEDIIESDVTPEKQTGVTTSFKDVLANLNRKKD